MRDYLAKTKIIKARKSGTYSRLLQRYKNNRKYVRTSNSNRSALCERRGGTESPEASVNDNPEDVFAPLFINEDEDLPNIQNTESNQAPKSSGNKELLDNLRSWTNEFHITHAALNSLVGILNTNLDLNLPNDARTIMKTPRTLNIIEMKENGQYWHNGVEHCLRKALSLIDNPMSISLNINTDGLPIHKSSLKNFWPILCNIHELPLIPPMAVGIFYGASKPKCATEFLTPFIDELLPILETGLVINGYHVTVSVRCFVCDSPARSFIKGVLNFNGKHGCLKCTTKGKYCHTAGTVVFPDINAPLRTNEKFRNKEYPEHQRNDTPLIRLPMDMVEDVIVADALHLLELGVMRKLLNGWRTGSMTMQTKWSTAEKTEISNFLVDIRFPKEIHRRMRSLDFVSLWKGLEYRNFLNYVGFVLLIDYLPEKFYQHFLKLFCAVRICSIDSHKCLLPVARELFNDFINDYKALYGIEYLTSNVHNLCHVVDEVEKFGPLPTLSAYPFENYLHSLKKMLRSGPLPLNQIANRLTELDNNTSKHITTALSNKSRAIQSVNKTGSKTTITLTDFILSTNFEDKWFLTKDLTIVCMKNAVENNSNWKVQGHSLIRKHDFFDQPFKSSFLHIYAAIDEKLNYSKDQMYDISSIMCKLVAIRRKGQIVFVPLIHTVK